MLTRTVKLQLILFVVITLIGVSYVSAEYVGLAKNWFGGNPCTIQADFPDSGGIFTNAEVTYRGVTVGQVGTIRLHGKGIRVDLNIEDCDSPRIPVSAAPVIANRSVVGEQYVDLRPPNDNPPFAHAGKTTLLAKEGQIPVPTQTLLINIDNLVNSVPLGDLQTTITELNAAFNGRGADLGRLLDSVNLLLQSALEPQNVDNTLTLIDNSQTVLSTQLSQQSALASWTHSLRLLSDQLKKSDPDFRHLLSTGPGDLGTVQSFISNNRADLGATLNNLAITGNMLVAHLGGIEEVLELYPALAAGGPTVLHDRRGALGLVLQTTPDPQDCGDPNKARQGYNGTRRDPANTTPIAPDVSARCTAPVSSGTNVRGSANVPGGDPISPSGGGVAYPRVATANTIGTADPTTSYLGDGSWMGLLTDSLR